MSAPPTLTHTGQRLLDALDQLGAEDAAHDYALATFVGALVAGADELADLSREGDDGEPGFAALFDPARCPASLLPFAMQFVGAEPLPGMTEEQMRTRYRETAGTRRGTPNALRGAARQYLIGPDGTQATATVYVNERQGGAYKLGVATLTSQTPDSAAVLRALMEQKPAGLTLTYTTVAGGDWATLLATHTDWADVLAQFPTWGDVRNDPSVT